MIIQTDPKTQIKYLKYFKNLYFFCNKFQRRRGRRKITLLMPGLSLVVFFFFGAEVLPNITPALRKLATAASV